MAILLRNKTTVYGLVTDLANLVAADAAETVARIAGDATLTTDLASEVTARTAAVSAEEAARIAGDATLTTNLATEVADRIAAVTAEATARTTADTTLTTNLATEVADRTAAITAETAARIAADTALQNTVDALGSAFNYVGTVAGGVDEAGATDLALLPAGGKDTGDYYKVSVAGWFALVGSAQAAFFANVNDGLVFNSVGEVDKIDNTNSAVQGVATFVTVTGSTDTGFTVDVATEFKTRVTTLETSLTAETAARIAAVSAEEAARIAAVTAEASARSTADATLTADLLAEIADRAADEAAQTTALQAYADAAAIAGGSIPLIEALIVTADKIVLAHAPKNGKNGISNFGRVSYVNEFNQEYIAPVTLDATDATGKTFIISVDVSGEWDTKTVLVQYMYVAGA